MKIKSLHLNKPILIALSIVLIMLGGGLGTLVTYNILHEAYDKDQRVYLVDPSKHAKYSVITVEKEPNDTFDKATLLTPGYATQGKFDTSTDIDMYYFNLENPANVQITLQNLPKEYNVFIYDANKLLIASSLRAGFSESSSVLPLSAPGKYYVKLVTKDKLTINSSNPYTILLSILPFVE